MIEPLRKPEYFGRAFLESGAPTWPNIFDLDPINLYMKMKQAGLLEHVSAAWDEESIRPSHPCP
jgi:hypothetical protein